MPEFKQVHDSIYVLDAPFLGVALTIYLIKSKQNVLIDSGISTTPKEFILPALEKLELNPDLLINTHGHVDHFGGNASLKKVFPEMQIAAHTHDAAWIEDHKRHFYEMYMCMPDDWHYEDGGKAFLDLCGENSAVDLHLEHGDTLELAPYSFQVMHSTGHSPGHIVLFDKKHSLAISGDVALGWGPEVAEGTPHAPSVYYNPSDYLEGVEMARALNAELYFSAHFGVLGQEDMYKICDQSHDFVQSFERWSLEALTATPKTLHQIATEVANHIPSYEFGYHIHASTQAHLMRYIARGHARSLIINNHKHYLKGNKAKL